MPPFPSPPAAPPPDRPNPPDGRADGRPARLDPDQLVRELAEAHVLDPAKIGPVVAVFQASGSRGGAAGLAADLVRAGLLTQFQADRAVNGEAGKLALGPYVRQEPIGSGSLGTVYRAVRRTDGGAFAVKVLPLRSLWNVHLAKKQVLIFRALPPHRAVVPFVDIDSAGVSHYLVWPFVQGETLARVVARSGPLRPADVVRYMAEVADGLAMCHRNGIVHGLLKPGNILIGPDDQPKILDLGIGALLTENLADGESLLDTISTTNTMTAMIDCAPPETLMQPTVRTAAGDAYSFGCVLYYLLTGTVPFPDGTIVEKMIAHQSREPKQVRARNPDVPLLLARVTEQLLAKKPEQRPQNMSAVRDSLLQSLPDPSRRPVSAESLPESVRGPVPPSGLVSNRQSTQSRPEFTPPSHYDGSEESVDFDMSPAPPPKPAPPAAPPPKPVPPPVQAGPALPIPAPAGPSGLKPLGSGLRPLSGLKSPSASAPFPKAPSGPAPAAGGSGPSSVPPGVLGPPSAGKPPSAIAGPPAGKLPAPGWVSPFGSAIVVPSGPPGGVIPPLAPIAWGPPLGRPPGPPTPAPPTAPSEDWLDQDRFESGAPPSLAPIPAPLPPKRPPGFANPPTPAPPAGGGGFAPSPYLVQHLGKAPAPYAPPPPPEPPPEPPRQFTPVSISFERQRSPSPLGYTPAVRPEWPPPGGAPRPPVHVPDAAPLLLRRWFWRAVRTVCFWLPPRELVQVSVFGPPEWPAGGVTKLIVYAHQKTSAEELQALSRAFRDQSALLATGFVDQLVVRGRTIGLHLSVVGGKVPRSLTGVVWLGQTCPAEFDIEVPPMSPAGATRAVLSVGIDGVKAGEVLFPVTIARRG